MHKTLQLCYVSKLNSLWSSWFWLLWNILWKYSLFITLKTTYICRYLHIHKGIRKKKFYCNCKNILINNYTNTRIVLKIKWDFMFGTLPLIQHHLSGMLFHTFKLIALKVYFPIHDQKILFKFKHFKFIAVVSHVWKTSNIKT